MANGICISYFLQKKNKKNFISMVHFIDIWCAYRRKLYKLILMLVERNYYGIERMQIGHSHKMCLCVSHRVVDIFVCMHVMHRM